MIVNFIGNTPIVRKKSRIIGGWRKKAYVVPSDSDSMPSRPSNYEYNISKEEIASEKS